MVLADLPMVLLRRWYIVMVGCLATLALGYQAYQVAPPAYTSTAEVLLLPPPTSVPAGGNPYLSLDGLAPAGDVVAKALSDESSTAALTAQGATGKFTVSLDGSAAAPLLLVTSEASGRDSSLATMNLVLGRIPVVLKSVQQQANVPENALIGSTVVTRTDQPVKSMKPVLRAVGLALAAGLTLTLLIVALLDGILIRRLSSSRSTKGHRRPRETAARTFHGTDGLSGDESAATVPRADGGRRPDHRTDPFSSSVPRQPAPGRHALREQGPAGTTDPPADPVLDVPRGGSGERTLTHGRH